MSNQNSDMTGPFHEIYSIQIPQIGFLSFHQHGSFCFQMTNFSPMQPWFVSGNTYVLLNTKHKAMVSARDVC